MSKADRLFTEGLDKLSDPLRRDVLDGRIKIRKSYIKSLALNPDIAPKSILTI